MLESWSPTEDRFLFTVTKGSDVSLWTLSLQDKKAQPFGGVQSAGNLSSAVFSPDGRWVAYHSNQMGREVLMVQPFPATGAKHQITTDAETPRHPVWSRDGKELFYLPGQGATAVRRISTTPNFTFGNPVPVQRGPLLFGGATGSMRAFDITPDAKILGTIDASAAQSGAPVPHEIRVVINWHEELKQKVPTQ